MKKFFLVFLALTTAAFGQGSLGDYSKNLKIASSTATSISVGTSGTSIVITGSTIAFGTGAVTTTGTLQSITVSGLQMSGGSGTLTGMLSGGSAQNLVMTGSTGLSLGTGTTYQLAGGTASTQLGTGQSMILTSGGTAPASFSVQSTGTAFHRISILPNAIVMDGSSGNMGILNRTGFSLTLGTNNVSQWQINNSGNFIPNTTNSYQLGESANQVKAIFVSGSASMGNVAVGTGALALGTASPVKPSAYIIPTGTAMAMDFTKASIQIGTAGAATTVTPGTPTANTAVSLILIGGSAGSTLTWGGGLGEAMLYVGTTAPVTALGSGQRLRLDIYSPSTGTADMIITRGP